MLINVTYKLIGSYTNVTEPVFYAYTPVINNIILQRGQANIIGHSIHSGRPILKIANSLFMPSSKVGLILQDIKEEVLDEYV